MLAQVLKAVAGAVTAFGTGMITAVSDGSSIAGGEWYAILGGTLIAFAAVWTVPNKAAPEQ